MKLSIIIPVFNEKDTILEILRRVEAVDLSAFNCQKEIILVDDFSTDGTRQILASLQNKYKVFFHEKNYGKGRAIRTGLQHATGDIVVIQDADLEYDPNDYLKLLAPIVEKGAKVVYGSRYLNRSEKSGWLYYFGGRFLSVLANFLYRLKITDEPTCYKMFRADVLKGVTLECEGFDFCPEITAKVARQGINIVEVPISYHPRSVKAGKKIKLKDGLSAIWTLFKYRFFTDDFFEKNIKWKIFILAAVNLVLVLWIFGLQTDLDSASYTNAINYLKGGALGESLYRMLKPFSIFFAFVFASFFTPEISLLLENVVFYFISAYLIFFIAEKIFKNKKTAFFACLFFITAYPLYRWGLAVLTDMSGWCFYLLVVYLALLFYEKKSASLVWLGGITAGVGMFFKETAAAGVMFFGFLVLLDKKIDWPAKIKILFKYALAFLFVLIPVSLIIFLNYHYSFVDWFAYNEKIQFHYTLKQSVIYFLENVFALMFIAWLFVLRGLFKILKEKNIAGAIVWPFVISSLSFLLWPFRVTRLMFIAGPALCLLAAKGLEFDGKKKQFVAYGFLVVCLIFNYFFPKFINLSVLQDLIDVFV